MTDDRDDAAPPARPLRAVDLHVGRTVALGSSTVSETEILAFATQWDPQSFHVEPDRAAAGPFGGVIASGLHTAGVFQRLAVEAAFRHWDVVAGRSLDLRFPRPVRPGAVLTGTLVVEDVGPDRSGRTTVTVRGSLVDDAGAQVLDATLVVVLRTGW